MAGQFEQSGPLPPCIWDKTNKVNRLEMKSSMVVTCWSFFSRKLTTSLLVGASSISMWTLEGARDTTTFTVSSTCRALLFSFSVREHLGEQRG